jgi:TrmH family RNA methyltransferase
VIAELADGGHRPKVLVCTAQAAAQRQELLHQLEALGTSVLLVSDGMLSQLTDTRTPQGMVAAYPSVVKDFDSNVLPQRGIVLVLDALQDPGNLGSLIRTADAVAAAGVLLLPGCVDPLNDKVVRSTMGSLFRVLIWRAKEPDALDFMAAQGWNLLCGHLRGEDFFARPDDGPKAALVIGNEEPAPRPENPPRSRPRPARWEKRRVPRGSCGRA